jgi:hypothetical protein
MDAAATKSRDERVLIFAVLLILIMDNGSLIMEGGLFLLGNHPSSIINHPFQVTPSADRGTSSRKSAPRFSVTSS